jgi:hypothetical protein
LQAVHSHLRDLPSVELHLKERGVAQPTAPAEVWVEGMVGGDDALTPTIGDSAEGRGDLQAGSPVEDSDEGRGGGDAAAPSDDLDKVRESFFSSHTIVVLSSEIWDKLAVIIKRLS